MATEIDFNELNLTPNSTWNSPHSKSGYNWPKILTQNLWRIWTVSKLSENTKRNDTSSRLNADLLSWKSDGHFCKLKPRILTLCLASTLLRTLRDRGDTLLTKLTRAMTITVFYVTVYFNQHNICDLLSHYHIT